MCRRVLSHVLLCWQTASPELALLLQAAVWKQQLTSTEKIPSQCRTHTHTHTQHSLVPTEKSQEINSASVAPLESGALA